MQASLARNRAFRINYCVKFHIGKTAELPLYKLRGEKGGGFIIIIIIYIHTYISFIKHDTIGFKAHSLLDRVK